MGLRMKLVASQEDDPRVDVVCKELEEQGYTIVDIQFCYNIGRGNNGSRNFMFMIKYKKLDK